MKNQIYINSKDYKICQKIYDQYIHIVHPQYKCPSEIVDVLKKDFGFKEDTTKQGLLKKKFHDSNCKMELLAFSKIYSIMKNGVKLFVYVDFSNEYIQADGDEEMAEKILILRGLKPEERQNKALFYHYVNLLKKYDYIT